MNGRTLLSSVVLAVASTVTVPTFALELEVDEPSATEVGGATEFSAGVSAEVGSVEIRWDFGDGSSTEFAENATQASHTYSAPGHYSVIVVARDDSGFRSHAFVHTVHRPIAEAKPRESGPLLYLEEQGLVVTANHDNDTVTFVDAESLNKLAEVSVFEGPQSVALAPNGDLWVVHREDYAIAVIDIDTFRLTAVYRLPYASQPMGVVFDEEGAAYVTLMALGEIAKLSVGSGEILERAFVAPWIRGISVSADGAHLWLTRFISPDGRGEVYQVSSATLQVETRVDLSEDTTTEDSDVQGRGLPNYLFSVAISPDGVEAWIPGKKDNMSRGLARDGLALTQDNTVRPLIAIVDLEAVEELGDARIDLDDRNLPRDVTFSPLGDYAFLSIYGSNMVEVWDVYKRSLVTGMRGSKGPLATVLSENQRLFVLGDSSRDLLVYDVSDVLSARDLTTRLVGEVDLVESEQFSDTVLLGKQLFANADDVRMASEGYLSCASCHLDGFEDGRVWEFSDRGEGLRNTTSLLGRRGVGHGPVHWSGNFDEIQDFEGAIRSGQGGLGFMSNEDFDFGTRSSPLGDPKAGLSPDLDALAAYVASLAAVPRSPYRNSDGSLTDDAQAGRTLFLELGCDSCHSGDEFTDSKLGVQHDVGTLTADSGMRLGEPLVGLDTPTLLGIWQTAPYLHDGSAPTLSDVLTTRNPTGAHGETFQLTDEELDQLVSYLQQIDRGFPPRDLVVPTDPQGAGGAGGASSEDETLEPSSNDPGCACDVSRPAARSVASPWQLAGVLVVLLAGWRRTRQRLTGPVASR